MLPESGVVTIGNWLMAPDGKRYIYLFCKHWRVITDASMPLPKFHSSEKWSLFGYIGQDIKVMIPGCQVRGYMACEETPVSPEMYTDDKYNETTKQVEIYNIE